MYLKHVVGLMINPEKEWQKIRANEVSIASVYFTFVIILGAIGPICGYYGTTQIGWSFGDGEPQMLTQSSALSISVLFYLAILISVFAMGLLVHWMGKSYGLERSLARCVQFAGMVVTPLFLLGFFFIFPTLWKIYLLGLPAIVYTVYLLYLGVPIMMDMSKEKAFLFSSAILAVGMVTLVGLLVTTAILWGLGLEPAIA